MKKENNKQEVLYCISKYIKDVHYVGDNCPIEFMQNPNFISNYHDFDAPDAYSIVGDTIYIFEHFRIDASKQSSGHGSECLRNTSMDLKRCEKIIGDKYNTLYSGNISYKSSSTNLLKNLLDAFNHHYVRISAYKKNVLNQIDNKNYKFITNFIIEDTGCFGSLFFEKGKFHIAVPNLMNEFLDVFEKSYDLDNVIFCTEAMNNQKVCWASNRADIDGLRKISYDILSKDILDSNTHTISTKIFIPFENKDE